MGASPARVTGLMLLYGLIPAMCGMAGGWLGALGISRFFSAMLFGVGPLDLQTWILVSGSMLVVACIASYLPARRACAVDPVTSLRAE
jgi:putative ABC transport system permease protein